MYGVNLISRMPQTNVRGMPVPEMCILDYKAATIQSMQHFWSDGEAWHRLSAHCSFPHALPHFVPLAEEW